MKNILPLLFVFCSIFTFSCSTDKSVNIQCDSSIPQAIFAQSELKNSLIAQEYTLSENAQFKITFQLENGYCSPESYAIIKGTNEIIIKAGDANGLMYGGLELAEIIAIGTKLDEVKNTADGPYILKRGIKYNIPLDVRTSSFDDSGDAAQENIKEMWNLSFWEAFFDNMARYRYNSISFWNAHPFSSMVKLEEYPDVALQDVCGTTIKPQENPNYWGAPELASPKIVANLKIEKKMTIDEKIVFWQKVMKHAKNRGIDVYFITWNICLNGAAVPGSNKEVGNALGKYGISNDYKNQVSIDYLRKSVKQFILNYPDLTGIGVTAGENMRKPMDDEDKEKWLWETYGLGIMDAKKEQPNRKISFIHRFWWTDMDKIMKYWGDYPDPFDMSFKYARAHMYSAVNPPFAKPLLGWMEPQNLKSWWNLRNDDIFIHRWGDPEYVSSFIKHLPYDQTAGFHMGSDGYVWGKEFISKNSSISGQLEIDKHWYKFMLWGRMGYNPALSQDRIKSVLGTKYPEVNSNMLLKIWATASKIIPQVNRFHWRDWDFMWQPEACMDSGHDLRTVDDFRTTATMEESGIMNIIDFVKLTIEGGKNDLISPLQVADSLAFFSNEAIRGAEKLMLGDNSEELKQTLLDIKSMGFLGAYYSHKIRAAVELEFFKNTGESASKDKAVRHLENALKSWEQYATINDSRYKRQNFARLRTFDWIAQIYWVKKDIELAKNAKTYEQDALESIN